MKGEQRTVSEVSGFIDMLHAACDDPYMNETLERLLSLTDKKRKNVILLLIEDMQQKGAPDSLIEAISCLVDDAVAEKAYEVIYQCSR